MKIVRNALLVAALSPLCSCAALFTGTTNEVTFTSNPTGCSVQVGDQTGTTPVTLTVSKSIDEVVFSLPGKPERTGKIDSSFGAGFLLMDLLFTPGFGTVGLLVDGFSYAWWTHPGIVHCDFDAIEKSKGVIFADADTKMTAVARE